MNNIKLIDLEFKTASNKFANSNDAIRVLYQQMFDEKYQLQEFELSLTTDKYNLVCFDVDSEEDRAFFYEMHLKGLLKEFTYTFDKITKSFHFYFLNTNPFLKNKSSFKNCFNLDIEILLDKVIVKKSNYECINFHKNLQPINILFFATKTKKWQLYDGVEEELVMMKNAVEGDGRSKFMYKLSSLFYKNTKRKGEILSFNDLSYLYECFNEVYFAQKLTHTEITNNINQVLKEQNDTHDNEVDTKLQWLVDDKVLITNNKGVVVGVDKDRYRDSFIKRYHCFLSDGKLYFFYENEYIGEDTAYVVDVVEEIVHYDMFYKIVAQEMNEIKEKHWELRFDTTKDFVNQLLEMIKKSVADYSNNKRIKNYIRVKNGVIIFDDEGNYRFTTTNLHEYRTVNSFTNIYYNDNIVENPKIDNWLKSTFVKDAITKEPDYDVINTFYEMLACCFFNHNKVRKMFVLHGEGSNGKSVVLNFIQQLINVNNFSNISLQEIDQQFALSALLNKTVNISDELPSYIDSNGSIMKSLVAGEKLSADVKFSNRVNFINKATLISASNHKFKMGDFNTAILDRLHIISFKARFTENQKDPNLLEKLLSDYEDYAYIFNKVLQAATVLIKNNWTLTPTNDNFENIFGCALANSKARKWLYIKGYTVRLKGYTMMLNKYGYSMFHNTEASKIYNEFKQWFEKEQGSINKLKQYDAWRDEIEEILKIKAKLSPDWTNDYVFYVNDGEYVNE